MSAIVGGGYDDNLVADARGGSTATPSDLSTRRAAVRPGFRRLLVIRMSRQSASASAHPWDFRPVLPRDSTIYSPGFRRTSPLGCSSAASVRVHADGSVPAVGLSVSVPGPRSRRREAALPTSTPRSPATTCPTAVSMLIAHARLGAHNAFSRLSILLPANASSGAGDFSRQSVGGQFAHQLGQGTRAATRVSLRQSGYEQPTRRPSDHLIDAGVDYTTALSFSRRTTLSFGTRYRLSRRDRGRSVHVHSLSSGGHATLNREIGRTWTAAAAYTRDVAVERDWRSRCSTTRATRSRWACSAGASSFDRSCGERRRLRQRRRQRQGRSFDTYYAQHGAASYALSAICSLGAHYSIYRHRFDDEVVLAPDVARASDSAEHSSGYLNVWTPLMQRSRRAQCCPVRNTRRRFSADRLEAQVAD